MRLDHEVFADFFEILDDFNMLSEIAVTECFYKLNVEEDGVC